MASATARPTFSFHHLPRARATPLHPPSKPSKLRHLPIPISSSPLHLITISTKHLPVATSSLDVSKDDKPLSQPTANEEEGEEQQEVEEEELEDVDVVPRRPEEKFAVLDTGVHECRSCGYLYKESAGDPSYPVPPGLQFAKLPEDWRCPTCGAARSFFVSKSVEVAGFAENQQFGLGANTLTSGQKALLIYGSLLFFFVLFLSGYFLQ
ncbi:uncharacterized protein M6B38_128355 [Iris pallida]|uniref:Rubredoxin-like domain-containing protein n=1 Tax=Iris pallida TaxID=29817 RepID=A0AAX6G5C3_IRIPA|nr:uncharacterized protein M6B38_128355 [Iris pallida]